MISDKWIEHGEGDLPLGWWLLRTNHCGTPWIQIVNVEMDAFSPGKQVIWYGAGGNWRWAHFMRTTGNKTHYTALENFAEVIKDIQ